MCIQIGVWHSRLLEVVRDKKVYDKNDVVFKIDLHGTLHARSCLYTILCVLWQKLCCWDLKQFRSGEKQDTWPEHMACCSGSTLIDIPIIELSMVH